MRRSALVMGVLVATLVAGALLGSAGEASAAFEWMKPPPDISKEGHRIDSLFYLVTWMLVLLFVIMSILLFGPMIFHRDGKSDHHVHFHRGNSSKDLAIAATISASIFFVVDGTLLVNSYNDLNDAFWNYPDGDPATLRVQIIPQQWAWNFRYAGTDGVFNTADDIVTINDFRIPTDRPIMAQLMAKDVLHSFSLPNVRRKQDAIPGSVTRFWFTAEETGEFEIVCAEMCGLQHYKMKALMTVYDDADYAQWHAEATRFAVASFDAEDEDAQWGWDWEAN